MKHKQNKKGTKMASTKKKSKSSKARLSPIKLGSKVEISPVLAIIIVVVMIAVGYLLVSMSFASGSGTTYNRAAKNAPQSCGQTTGHVWIGLTSDPGGQTECMGGSTVYPKAGSKR